MGDSPHLADVDGGVERLADVHAQVGAQQVEVPRQRVQLDLRQSHIRVESTPLPCSEDSLVMRLLSSATHTVQPGTPSTKPHMAL